MNTKSIQISWLNDFWKENINRNKFEEVHYLERSTLLNKTNAVRKNVIPFSVTCSPDLPNIREIISKH